MIIIENQDLIVKIKKIGAELCSIFNKNTKTEYIWQADPAYWAKSSPILFPIVGGLKNNQYQYQNKTYSLPRHGFAREMPFEVLDYQSDSVILGIKNNDETFLNYPFEFELKLAYSLNQNQLNVNYLVSNPGQNNLLFSVGAHPAFNVPLNPALQYNNYYLEFNQEQNFEVFPLNLEGQTHIDAIPLETNKNKLNLHKPLFYNDALVFKNLKGNQIVIKSDLDARTLTFGYEGFPYFGIWAAKDADFVCLEPWCGIADNLNHDLDFTQKEGINLLEPNGVFDRSWFVVCA